MLMSIAKKNIKNGRVQKYSENISYDVNVILSNLNCYIKPLLFQKHPCSGENEITLHVVGVIDQTFDHIDGQTCWNIFKCCLKIICV